MYNLQQEWNYSFFEREVQEKVVSEHSHRAHMHLRYVLYASWINVCQSLQDAVQQKYLGVYLCEFRALLLIQSAFYLHKSGGHVIRGGDVKAEGTFVNECASLD